MPPVQTTNAAGRLPRPGHVDHDLDVLGSLLERRRPVLNREPPGDQSCEPARVGSGQCVGCLVVVAASGVDRGEHDLVPQHEILVQRVQPRLSDALTMGDAGECDDGPRRGQVRRVDHHLSDPGALDHDVGRESQLGHGGAVVVGAQVGHEAGRSRPR